MTDIEPPLSQPFRVGRLTVDPARRAIDRDGEALTLEPKAFDVLLYLASQKGRVVSKRELLDAVWRDRVVTDDSVYRAVRMAREAFGSAGPRVLQTVHRRGYRCTAEVQLFPRSRLRRIPAAAALATLAAVATAVLLLRDGSDARPELDRDGATVAVLPFKGLDESAQLRYVGDGLAAELIADLGRVHGIDVIGPASAFASGDSGRQPGPELGAAAVVKGSWRRAGDQIAVHVEISEPETGRLLWSRTFRRAWEEIPMLRTALARAIAEVLEPRENGASATYFPTASSADAQAYNLFLRARQLWRTREPSELDRAVELLQRAIAKSPDFALAHEALGSVYMVLPNWQTVSRKPVRSLAYAAAREALRLDPRLGEARAILAQEARARGQWRQAERLYRRALDEEPGNATIWQWFAEFLLLAGRVGEAVEHAEQAVHLDPMAPMPRTVLAWAELIDGRSESAARHADRAIDLGLSSSRIIAAWAAVRRGRYETAAAKLDGLLRPSAAIESCRSAVLGRITTQEAVRSIAVDERSDELAVIYHLVCLAMLGGGDAAFEVIAAAPQSMAFAILWADEFSTLRSGPRFRALLAETGLDAP